jgi:hypothetical protein
VICLAFGVLSAQQAIALCLPAALLIIAGLVIAAGPDHAAIRRAGFLAGSLLSRWRAFFRGRRNGS